MPLDTNSVLVSPVLLALIARQISTLIKKFEMELNDKAVTADEVMTLLRELFGRKVVFGSLKNPQLNTGAIIRTEFASLGFKIDLGSATLISQFLQEWHPGSPQCDWDYDHCGLYAVDVVGKELTWLEPGNLCTYCGQGTVQHGEGQQTHHWNWITGKLVAISETVHHGTGMTEPLQDHDLRPLFAPTLMALLEVHKVSAGQFLAYLMHADHGLPVHKDSHSVKESVGLKGSLIALPERTIKAHVVKAKQLEGKAVTEPQGAITSGTMPQITGRLYEASELRELHEAFVALFDVQSAPRLWRDCGLGMGTAPAFHGAASTVWFEVLQKINDHGKIDHLIRIAAEEYPRNPVLQAYLSRI